jgi:hypothetical protein
MSEWAAELKRMAGADIDAARAAALRARASHARSELVRHMLATAAKVTERPRPEAIEFVVGEWMAAWGLDAASCRQRPAMAALAGACQDFVRDPGAANDRALREAFAALERSYEADRTTLADEMAWRSSCAHGWWADVRPAPACGGYSTLARRAESLWERGCAPHCR